MTFVTSEINLDKLIYFLQSVSVKQISPYYNLKLPPKSKIQPQNGLFYNLELAKPDKNQL